MKFMSEYNRKWQYITLCWNSDHDEWLEVTTPVVHSQCLLIYFNIFNGKKYCVAW